MSVSAVNHGVSFALPRGATKLHPESVVVATAELRQVVTTENPALAQALAALAARYRIDLTVTAQCQIVASAAAAGSAVETLRAGLYLNRVGATVTPDALAALVVAQQLPTMLHGNNDDPTPTTLGKSDTGAAALGQLLVRVMAQDDVSPDANLTSSFGDPNSGSPQQQGNQGQRQPERDTRRALSQQLLNLPDGGAMDYRYETLPLLVAGRLVELDMALFQQKSAPVVSQRRVMSLDTQLLGGIRIVAQSLHSNLNVTLASTSKRGVSALTTALGPMRQRLQALGWQVDGMRCELASDVISAGSEIIDHVLTTGSMDQTL
jgi:hypothetical protein